MRTCQYKFCKNDISHKVGNTDYCSMLCRGRQKALRLFLISFQSPELDRWAQIGNNSSYEAMLSVYKLFSEPKYKTVMSKL